MEKNVQAFEQKAREFVTLTLAVCEQELAAGRTALTPPPLQKSALAAAALSVQESVKTFLAVSAIPDSGNEDKR